MGWIDFIDGLNEFLPRRWKRGLAVAMAVVFLAFPTQAQRAFLWYGQEKAHQIAERIVPALLPVTTPSSTSTARPTLPAAGRSE